jgi:hypothetical protein
MSEKKRKKNNRKYHKVRAVPKSVKKISAPLTHVYLTSDEITAINPFEKLFVCKHILTHISLNDVFYPVDMWKTLSMVTLFDWTKNNTSTPPLFIEMYVQIHDSERSGKRVLGVH